MTVEVDEGKKPEEQSRFLARLQATLNLVPAHTWYAASSGGLTFVNKRTADYLGLPNDHPLRFGIDVGAQWDSHIPLLHPDDHQETRKVWSTCLRTGEAAEANFRVCNAQGGYRWYRSRAEPLRASDGTLLQWIGVNVDIEELKCAEDALRESEQNLRMIIDTIPAHVVRYRPDGLADFMNQTFSDFVGPGIGFDNLRSAVHPEDYPERSRDWDTHVAAGKPYDIEMRVRRADGVYRWHRSRRVPLRDANGAIVNWYGAGHDIDDQKRAEQALRRSEAYLAEAQRVSHTGSSAYNATEIVYWSEEASRIWGVDPVQGIPSREEVWQRIHPDDLDRVNENIERGVRERRNFANEFRIVLPGGAVKHIEATNNPVFSASGEFLEIVVTGIDVTERKRAEEALRESEAKFRDYAETASDWFWEIGADYKFTLLTQNPFSGQAAQRLGMAWWDRALDLETEPGKWRLIQATLDSRQPFRDFVYRGLGSNGSPMYVRASGKAVFDANGEFRGYRGTAADVTAIMRAQEALRESERSSRLALDGIPGLVAVMAPNGELEAANRQCLEYFGRSLEWLKDWGTNDAVYPEDLPRVVEAFGRAIASGLPYQVDSRLRGIDGEYRWFEARGVPVRDGSGHIARWYILLTDIDDRTQALARLEQMQSDLAHMNRVSMMGELAASLSHEIKQPIASARNNARAAQNFLDMRPPELGEVREALSCVVDDADRAGDIIDRIRDHLKKAPPRTEQFDLNDAIKEVIGLGRSAIIKNRVWVQTRLSEGLFPVHGDRIQLQQVVLNLLLNAVEAMGSVEAAPRELSISTEQDHTGVLVAVRDSGPGLDPPHLERVFDAFYTTKSSGMGMGLPICRSIIDAHGGQLWAEANEPRGAIFQFTLPAA
ncbi:PAS domain-containing protein [Bradyrhizobium sp. F1.13.3]|uniref:PAS domain-containing protein n=1 Tax=Bradyrhizobium sp. F1.13.3 TaxID=3156351 RepID=UPI003397120A